MNEWRIPSISIKYIYIYTVYLVYRRRKIHKKKKKNKRDSTNFRKFSNLYFIVRLYKCNNYYYDIIWLLVNISNGDKKKKKK